jgi:hypothetical protein
VAVSHLTAGAAGVSVTFDASGTSDPDSKKLTYQRDLTSPA